MVTSLLRGYTLVYTLKRETARSESEASEQHGFLKGLFQPWDHNLPAASEARQVWACLGLEFIIYWGNGSCWVRVWCVKRPNVLPPALTASGKPWLGAVTTHNLTCSFHFLCGVWNDSSHHRTLSTDWAEDVSQGKGEWRRARQEMPVLYGMCLWMTATPLPGEGEGTQKLGQLLTVWKGCRWLGLVTQTSQTQKEGYAWVLGQWSCPHGAHSEVGVAAFRTLHPYWNWPFENKAALELAVHQSEHCTAQLLPWPVTGSLSGVSTPEYCSPPPKKVCHSVVFFDRSFEALLRDMFASCPTHNFRWQGKLARASSGRSILEVCSDQTASLEGSSEGATETSDTSATQKTASAKLCCTGQMLFLTILTFMGHRSSSSHMKKEEQELERWLRG